MRRNNAAYKTELDDFVSKPPDLDKGEVKGIKLRDSLFIVYSSNGSVSGSEFIYNLKSVNGGGEMVFDNNMVSCVSTGGPENCGVYMLEDGRILEITSMKDWHFAGYFFKDHKEWVQFSEYADRNSHDSQ